MLSALNIPGVGGLGLADLLKLLMVLAGSFLALIWAFSQVLIGQFDKRLASFEKRLETDLQQVPKLHNDLLEFKLIVAQSYVRREDAVRQEIQINAKLDALARMIQQIQNPDKTNGH